MLKITLLYSYCFKAWGGEGGGGSEWGGGNKQHIVKSNILSAIWGSQDGNNGDYCFQGCDILKTDAVNS